METKRPVALWKGITGTAVSGFLLVLVFLIFLLFYVYNKLLPDWAIIWILVAFIIGIFSLIISIINIRDALEYKNQLDAIEKASIKKDNSVKNEILHRLLSEGKITIEEYDEFSKIRGNKKCGVLFVTQEGKRDEKILGIITLWDIVF